MFEDHLIKSKTTYIMHLKWAFLSGILLIYAGISSIIHGIFPNFFDGTAPKIIIKMYHSHLVNHPNPEYKKMIKSASEK